MTILKDLRYGVRMLRKDAAFTLVAVLSLALGTGANSAMFSFLNGILLRPLPVLRPSEVMTITPKHPDDSFDGISYPDYADLRDGTRTLQDLTANMLFRFGFSPSQDALPQAKYGLLVTGNLFQAMGVTPILGRAFRTEEDQVPGRDAVVILGHDFWKDEFGGDPQVIGRMIRLNGLDFTVIGVAPETFTGMDEFFKVTMFVPTMMASRLIPGPANNPLTRREWHGFTVKGRLKPGFEAAQAETELASISKGLEEAYPATNAGRSFTLRTEVQMHFQHLPRESSLMVLAMIMGALVLLISCFNVANLLLSRTRRREVAVRLAIGAGRARLVRQLLTESLLLGVAGALAGLWFSWISSKLLNRIRVPSDLPFNVDIRSDHRVLLFSLAAGLFSVFFFGLVPALKSSRVDLVPALKSTDDAIGSSRRRSWGRNALVMTQITISVVILIIATMLYHGFATQLYGGAGLRTSHVLMMSFDPRIIRYSDDQTAEFYRRLAENVGSAPGVKSAAIGVTMPFAMNQRSFSVTVSRESEQHLKDSDKDHILADMVDEHFLDVMAVPIVRGRGFQASDKEDTPPVAIVNEVLAQKYWPGEEAVGKRIAIDTGDGPQRLAQVIGVARTTKYVWLTEGPTEYLYLPLAQHFRRQRTLFVESVNDASALTLPVRDVVRRLDPNMPAYDVRTIEEYFTHWVVASANDTLYIVGSMGLTGLILAMIGLYGLVSYSVSRRTREFGIRMAIGASKGSVLGMVLRQGTFLCLAGIVGGIVISIPGARLLQSIVFGATSDWVPYIVVPGILLLVTLASIYGPARRASVIDPMKALREE